MRAILLIEICLIGTEMLLDREAYVKDAVDGIITPIGNG
jgi:hypothetical protein